MFTIGSSLGLRLVESTRTEADSPDVTLVFFGVLNYPNTGRATYDIFEGTEQIQQLVISRAISGMRIE